MVIHGNLADAEAEESKGSFHPNTIRTLQKNPKFGSLFNQLGFGLEARRIATESFMSIATNQGWSVSQRNLMLVELSWKKITQ